MGLIKMHRRFPKWPHLSDANQNKFSKQTPTHSRGDIFKQQCFSQRKESTLGDNPKKFPNGQKINIIEFLVRYVSWLIDFDKAF